MNQKKCPKCGEMNPGEAVMCWACYTPLTGAAVGAGAAGGGGVAAVGAPAVVVHDDEGRKKAIPPWQMGLVAVGLLVLLGVGYKTMSGSSEEDSGTTDGNTVATYPTSEPRGNGGGGSGGGNSGGGGVPAPPSSGASLPPAPIPYSMAASPNPNLQWRIMAIVPNDPNTSSQAAAQLAKYAKTAMGAGQNVPMQIYVFSTRQAGQAFSQFQIPRRSDILGPGDYQSLSQLWPQCLARYEFNGGRETILYPSRQGVNWWARSR